LTGLTKQGVMGGGGWKSIPDPFPQLEERFATEAACRAYVALLPRMHRVASLLERWLLGTHPRNCLARSSGLLLDEFTFRLNRQTSKRRGKLLFRLVE